MLLNDGNILHTIVHYGKSVLMQMILQFLKMVKNMTIMKKSYLMTTMNWKSFMRSMGMNRMNKVVTYIIKAYQT